MGAHFDGTSSRLRIATGTTLALGGSVNYTLFAWAKHDDAPTLNEMHMAHFNSAVAGTWFLNTTSTDKFNMHRESTPDFNVESTSTIVAGTWAMATGTYTTGTNGTKIWFDGVNEVSDTFGGTGVPSVNTHVGCLLVSGAAAQFFDGILAECCIWTDDLTSTEIKTLERGVSPFVVRHDELIRWYLHQDSDFLNDWGSDRVTAVEQGTALTQDEHPPVELIENYL